MANEMDPVEIVYIAASVVVILLIMTSAASYGYLAFLVVVFGIIMLFLVFMLEFADFLIFPLITKYLDIEVILSKEHKVPKTQNYVLKYVDGLYYATGYLTANIYKYVFSAEKTVAEEGQGLNEGPDKWERIIMNTKFPFKFNVISVAEDVQKYRETLEGQRGYLEFELSKEQKGSNPDSLTIRDFERRINIIQTRIDRISEGELPIYSTMYIESTAVGVSEKEASDILTEQLRHLQTVFNVFDLSISRITGRELHMLYTLNYRLMSTDELNKNFQAQT